VLRDIGRACTGLLGLDLTDCYDLIGEGVGGLTSLTMLALQGAVQLEPALLAPALAGLTGLKGLALSAWSLPNSKSPLSSSSVMYSALQVISVRLAPSDRSRRDWRLATVLTALEQLGVLNKKPLLSCLQRE